MKKKSQFLDDSKLIRKKIIDTAHYCGESSHIGGSLSMVDVLSVLYGSVIRLNPENIADPNRDIFILSKGHCVLGYYSVLNHFGFLSDDVFKSFQKNGSHLIAHPVKNLELGIESSNGSLGQGLSFGIGIALGMRLDEMHSRRVYVLMGDGECNEGSVWEAAASASEFKVNNLIAIIDINSLRNDGKNTTYISQIDYKNIWTAFGWNVIDIDGHDYSMIVDAFESSKLSIDKPTVILARTIKGKGVTFMEGNNDWHHNRITSKIYDQIIEEWKDE